MFLVLLFAVTLFIGEGTAYPTTISKTFFEWDLAIVAYN